MAEKIYLRKSFCEDLRLEAPLQVFKIVEVPKDFPTSAVSDEEIADVIKHVDGPEYKNKWIFPQVHIEDDIITVKFKDNQIRNAGSLWFFYDVPEMREYNKLAMIVSVLGSTDLSFEDKVDNYIQFNFRCFAGLTAPLRNFSVYEGTDDNDADVYPERKDTAYVKVVPPTDHRHELFDPTEHLPENIENELNHMTLMQKLGYFENMSEDHKNADFIFEKGVADCLSDGSMYGDIGLVISK